MKEVKEKKEREDSGRIIYKDDILSIGHNKSGYMLNILKIKENWYYANMEQVLMGILEWYRGAGFHSGYKKNITTILDLKKCIERSDLKIKELAMAIPYREKGESQDVKVINAEEYFSKDEDYFVKGVK